MCLTHASLCLVIKESNSRKLRVVYSSLILTEKKWAEKNQEESLRKQQRILFILLYFKTKYSLK